MTHFYSTYEVFVHGTFTFFYISRECSDCGTLILAAVKFSEINECSEENRHEHVRSCSYLCIRLIRCVIIAIIIN